MRLLVAVQEDLPPGGPPAAQMLAGEWAYFGDDSAWRVAAERGVLRDLERLDTSGLVQEAAWRLRRPYIDWIGELSCAHGSPEWWASELAAKNSYTLLYNRVCSLAAARQLLRDRAAPTLVVCGTAGLGDEVERAGHELGHAVERLNGARRGRVDAAHARIRSGAARGLRAWGRVVPEPLRSLPARVAPGARHQLDASQAYRRGVLAAHGVTRPSPLDGAVLLLTWADERSVNRDGVFDDPHFGRLPSLLAERGLDVTYVPRVLPGVAYEPMIRRLVGTGERFVFPELVVDDAARADAAARARAYVLPVPDDAEVEGVPVATLAREHAVQFSSAMAQSLEHAALAHGLAAHGIRPALIVYTHEGHSWENAFIHAARAVLPETQVVGYENVNMTRLALSLYPAAAEIDVRPLPDRLVTNGPAFARILAAEGFPPDRVREGCGLRHAYLWSVPPSRRRHGSRVRVLVATDVLAGQAVELVAKAAAAFGRDDRYEVVVKCHPLLDAERVRDTAGGEAEALRFERAPFGELLREADVLLYMYSVVCYEALARGVPAVFVRAETFHDLDQLEPFSDLRPEGRSPAEIRQAVELVLARDGAELEEWRSRAVAAAREALAPCGGRAADAFLPRAADRPL